MLYFSLVLIIVSLISFIKCTTLIFKKSGNRVANYFLAGFFLIISIYTFQGFAIETGVLASINWFYCWPLPIYALIHVSVFFYYNSLIKNKWIWKPSYLLLFIPFVLAIIDVYFFYTKPSSEIREIIEEAILKPDDRFERQYGLFTLKSHFLIRYASLFLVVFVLWLKLIPFIRSKTTCKILVQTNRWAFGFLLILSVICLSSIILIFAKCFPYFSSLLAPYNSSFGVLMLSATFLLAILPFYFPVIFYSYPNHAIFHGTPASVSDITTQKTVNINEDCNNEDKIKFGLDLESFKERLLAIEKLKPYLSPDFDINTLAVHLEIPIHHLSYLLNHHYGLSFANYRNNKRMEHAVNLIEEGFLILNTIEALAVACGFASRSAFSKTFKAVVGKSPSDYSPKLQMIDVL